MGFTLDTLNDVRRQNAAADPALGAARKRRDTVCGSQNGSQVRSAPTGRVHSPPG
jgi:hypothetical protein